MSVKGGRYYEITQWNLEPQSKMKIQLGNNDVF